MTRSLPVALLGAEFPQIIHEPPNAVDFRLADDALDLADAYRLFGGFDPSPSQRMRVRNGMACRADGRWAATRVGDFGGRQGAGKSDTIITRMFGGTLLGGEALTIYTAHEFPTANEIFLRIGSILEAWDDLSGLVLHERRAHGDQGFELRGPRGSEITGKRRWLFKTRTGKSGRGFAKADLLVYDEAQHLHAEHVAGSGPAKLANPNAQSWYAGSGGFSTSSKAWEMRRQAITGSGGRLSYTEHTAEVVSLNPDGSLVSEFPDPTDFDAWARANPGLGRWIEVEGMEAMLDELGPDLFARECLCLWEPEVSALNAGPISPARWGELIDGESMSVDDAVCLGLDAPDGRSSAWFSVWGRRSDGLPHAAIRYHVPPERIGEVAAIAKELADGHGCGINLPPKSPAEAWREAMEALGVAVNVVKPDEFRRAQQAIEQDVADGSLRHRGQVDMATAVAGLASRASGDLSLWSRRSSSSDVAPMMALAAARAGGREEREEFFSLVIGG